MRRLYATCYGALFFNGMIMLGGLLVNSWSGPPILLAPMWLKAMLVMQMARKSSSFIMVVVACTKANFGFAALNNATS